METLTLLRYGGGMGSQMRSPTPMPGNLWPQDMVITVEDDSQALLDLLWIREAWQLDPVGSELPPRLVATPNPEPASADADREAWSNAWPEIWRACLTHAAEERDASVFDRLRASSTRPQERLELLSRLHGPSWQGAFGGDAFTEQHEEWNLARFEERTSPSAVRKEPERQCLEQLVPAWRAGLTKLIVIPCHGTFTRRVGDHALLVTAETRAEVTDYASALRSFE
ncbi:hypothetical protein [Curtobacterium sp. ISL-83]|uniref:hypothetical protein n=1 Tax=Curtobacterium sp. ISL-83 TaxID=2819145 RepID=UPI001BECCC5E|nr:hypothetical protein [Curtobacterium sp. ISL-83]MBT2503736.1 hypothetical protein [Curtobacterium sp. ISL-83]